MSDFMRPPRYQRARNERVCGDGNHANRHTELSLARGREAWSAVIIGLLPLVS